jgi:hypothetical protein
MRGKPEGFLFDFFYFGYHMKCLQYQHTLSYKKLKTNSSLYPLMNGVRSMEMEIDVQCLTGMTAKEGHTRRLYQIFGSLNSPKTSLKTAVISPTVA